MSSSSKSDGEGSFDVEELVVIGTRCRELRKEKDLLRESQSQSFELIRRLERHAKSLSEAHAEDKKHIQKLERELLNCSQEIDYLQDQLNARNAEVYNLGEHVHELELQLADMENLRVDVSHLTEELNISHSKHLALSQELSSKEEQLRSSCLLIENLEETISSITLDSQCEIESMRLDKIALEEAFIEAKKVQEETAEENARMNRSIKELELRAHCVEKNIGFLEKENMDLKEKLLLSEIKDIYPKKFEEWMENNNVLQPNNGIIPIEPVRKRNMLLDIDMCKNVLGCRFAELAIAVESKSSFTEQIERMSDQISEYEVLVKQLKEELREEKCKAKEEAEDLTQEMAELRYQMTNLLEEECKRRASIEQASLLRIAELEAQLKKEQSKIMPTINYLHEP